MTVWLLFCFLGIFVGLAAGLFGIGGGVLIVPSLLLSLRYLGVQPDLAIFMATRTSLAIIFFTSLFSAYSHHQKAPLNKKILGQLVLFVVIGTVIGSLVVNYISADLLELIFMIYISFIALKMWFGFKVEPEEEAPPLPVLLNIIVGTLIGFKSAILGIGGGTISIPYLTWQRVSMKQAVGISAALGFIIATSGCIMTLLQSQNLKGLPPHSLGLIYIPALLGVISTSLFFARLGSRYAYIIPQQKLRKAFAFVLFIIALRAIFKYFHLV